MSDKKQSLDFVKRNVHEFSAQWNDKLNAKRKVKHDADLKDAMDASLQESMAKFQAEVDEKHKHNLEELGKVARQEKRDTHESGFEYNVEDVPTDGEIKNQAQSNAMLQKMVTTPADKFYGKEEAVKELQRINDVTLISSRISKRHPRELDYFKHGLMKNSELAKALGSNSTFSATGAEWVPTIFSNDFIARMEQEYVVANTIQTITIPSGTRTMKVPAAGAGIDVTTYTQNAGDNLGDNYATNAIGAATPASRNIELDPIKFAVRVELEEEAVEDMIVDIVEQITLPEMRLAAAKGLDDAIINGDADATHQDGDVHALGASDRRKAFDGLRKAGLAGTAKADAISGSDTDGVINITDIKTVLGAMKAGNNVYYDPDNLRLLCNLKVYIDLLTMTETLPRDKIGESLMTIDKGQLAGVMGIPIIRTELMRGDLSAPGYHDASGGNDYTSAIIYHTRAYLIGQKRDITVKTAEDIEFDRRKFVLTYRAAFEAKYAASENHTGLIHNLAE